MKAGLATVSYASCHCRVSRKCSLARRAVHSIARHCRTRLCVAYRALSQYPDSQCTVSRVAPETLSQHEQASSAIRIANNVAAAFIVDARERVEAGLTLRQHERTLCLTIILVMVYGWRQQSAAVFTGCEDEHVYGNASRHLAPLPFATVAFRAGNIGFCNHQL